MSYRERLAQRQAELGRPLRVALIGAGQMGMGMAAQVLRMPGTALSAVIDIDPDRAVAALAQAGVTATTADSTDAAVRVIDDGGSVALRDADVIGALPIDVVVEATGIPDVGARVFLSAVSNGIHYATLNVETDVTVGTYLRRLSDEATGIYSVCRGDEPVETKILVDFARDLGFDIVAAGKGKNNPFKPYTVPSDLVEEAARKKMNPQMLCEFVDGSKAMIEMAALANTTGLEVSTRGMYGPASTVETLNKTFSMQSQGGVLDRPGVVDYCTGPVAPGVFVVATHPDAYVNHEMTYLLMGDGPNFTFYRPYHLASIEAPLTIYDMVLDGQASMTAEHWTAEVAAMTKRPLRAGETLDGVGGYMVRGIIDKADDFARANLAPLGVLNGARVVRDLPQDHLITRDDVELVEDATIVRLRHHQDAMARGESAPGLAALAAELGL